MVEGASLLGVEAQVVLHSVHESLESYYEDAPSKDELRHLRSLNADERWAEQVAARERRIEAAVSALAAHPGFSSCKNMATRKALLMKLGLDLEGLNKEEILQLAVDRLKNGDGDRVS